MLYYSTRFPVDRESTVEEFFAAISTWILGMRQTNLNSANIQERIAKTCTTNREFSSQAPGETITAFFGGANANQRYCGARYTKDDDRSINWITEAIYSDDSTGNPWVTVRSLFEVGKIGIPPKLDPKPPQLPRLIIQHLNGGIDGQIPLVAEAQHLQHSDIEFAADALYGRLGNRLPIVYCSASFAPDKTDQATRLAKRLHGLAHVFQEPSRAFSNRMRVAVQGFNAYGGALGVYWPDGRQRRLFYIGNEIPSEEDLDEAIISHIQENSREVRLPADAYWTNLLERVRAAQLEEARNESQRKIDAKDSDIASAKREKDEFIEGFDKETPALKAEVVSLKEQRTRAELEIERLTARVTQLTQKYGADGSGIFMAGSEVDFYIDERKFVVVDALRHYLTQACPSDSRRAHILKDILSKNEVGCTVEHELSELKVQFNGFRSLLPSMRATLAKLGFTIDESGSHVKLTWYDDARYTFTLPKSGSDGGRGGKNSYAAMKKLLF